MFEELDPPYSTIVADPPWPFVWGGQSGGRRARATPLTYTLSTVTDIAALPVSELAATDSYLFLWATGKMFREGNACVVAREWGFEPFADYVWEKPNLGAGAVPRICHEPMLVARRGSPPVSEDRSIRSVQRWKQNYGNNGGKQHSAKPDAALDLVERVSPGPYVELFCRRPRLGWDSWGHGYELPVGSDPGGV